MRANGMFRKWIGVLCYGTIFSVPVCFVGCTTSEKNGTQANSTLPVVSSTSIIDPLTVNNSAQTTGFPLSFKDTEASSGINWSYDNGARGAHWFIETTGGGVAFFDYDNDGWLDIFAPQGGVIVGTKTNAGNKPYARRNVLYHNNHNGTFSDVTSGSGLDAYTNYGQAVSVADYDNDGRKDLYISAYGGNHLFRNQGRGQFKDVTIAAGLSDTKSDINGELPWPISSAWADYDRDGDLDVLVCHYARWSPQINKPCKNPTRKVLSYCRPQVYEPSSSRIFQNNGDGTFTDVSKKAGIANLQGKAMVAAWFDYNDDGWIDCLVSNDTMPNWLLHNNRNGTFTEKAVLAGVATGADGEVMSGMGIGVGDYNNDTREDLFVVNFSQQAKSVYRNMGSGLFQNESYTSNIASTNLQFIGFGLEACDYDLDGWKDLIVGNGHVLDLADEHVDGSSYAQSQQLLHNEKDGTFKDDLKSLGDLVKPQVTRGLAVGDYDNDGDWDVVMVAHDGPMRLFRNEGGNKNHWITISLEGKKLRDAIGAKITIAAGGKKQVQRVRGGSSYASFSDSRVTFGLGQLQKVDSVEIRWADGAVQKLGSAPSNFFYLARQGKPLERDLRIN